MSMCVFVSGFFSTLFTLFHFFHLLQFADHELLSKLRNKILIPLPWLFSYDQRLSQLIFKRIMFFFVSSQKILNISIFCHTASLENLYWFLFLSCLLVFSSTRFSSIEHEKSSTTHSSKEEAILTCRC